MANDIKKIDSSRDINTITTVCSTTKTGETAKLIAQTDYPVDLTIDSIQAKFDDRFDDPRYYYGSGN